MLLVSYVIASGEFQLDVSMSNIELVKIRFLYMAKFTVLTSSQLSVKIFFSCVGF